MCTTRKEDIDRLISAYQNHKRRVTLSDGSEIERCDRGELFSCDGCVFSTKIGCYCENGEQWVQKRVNNLEKTIEERAKEYSTRNFDGFYNGFENAEYDAYVVGAKKQREIDIDFVRVWLCINVVGTTLTQDDIKALTKAMEE